jgi:hypothetical protein
LGQSEVPTHVTMRFDQQCKEIGQVAFTASSMSPATSSG